MTNKATISATTTSAAIPEAVLKAANNRAKLADAGAAPAEDTIVRRQSDAANEEPKLYVYDLTAERGPRTHEFVDGRGIVTMYNFPDKSTPRAVPYSAAIRLIDNSAFMVVDEEGNTLEANKERDEHVTLKSNETIARYDQLKYEALAEICKRLKAPKTVTKAEEMVSWLVAYNQEREDARARADELGISRSLQEIISDAGGDLSRINHMDEAAVRAAAGSGDPLADVSNPQSVAV